MEPTTLIIGALAAGVTAVTKEIASQVVIGVYAELKTLIK